MKMPYATLLVLLALPTLTGCQTLCKHFCDAPAPDAMGELAPEGVQPEDMSGLEQNTIEIADTNCPLTLHIQTHEPQKNAAGQITGFAWADIPAPAQGASMTIPINRPVRTYATMSNGCQAKITISKHGNIANKRFSNSPPVPGQNVCTAHKEVIWWGRRLQNAAQGKPNFWAYADCAPCAPATCTGNAETTQKIK